MSVKTATADETANPANLSMQSGTNETNEFLGAIDAKEIGIKFCCCLSWKTALKIIIFLEIL